MKQYYWTNHDLLFRFAENDTVLMFSSQRQTKASPDPASLQQTFFSISQSVYFHKQINKKKCNSQQTSQLHHFDPKTISSTISVPLLFSTNHCSFQDPPKPSKICSFQTPNHHKKSYLELQQLMPLCLKLHSCGLVDFAFTMPSWKLA